MTQKRKRHINYLGRVISAGKTPNGLSLDIDGATGSVEIIEPEIIRVRVEFDGIEPGPDRSWSVVKPHPEKADFEISSTDHEWELCTGPLYAMVNRDPFRVVFYDRSRRVLSEDVKWGGAGTRGGKIYCEKVISEDEHFYGFGEKAFTIDRRGKKMEMWTTDAPGHQWESDPLYVSVPFFIGLHNGAAYGILFDSTWRSRFEMGGINRRYYTYRSTGGALNYYFIAGPDIKDVLKRYTRLTGRITMPPLWSIGFQQSRWSYRNETKVRYIAEKMREKDIPCDVIHLDIHYMQNYRVFTWNKNRFPNPAKMMKELADDGMRIVTIMDPGVKIDNKYKMYKEGIEKDLFCRNHGGAYFRGIVWPGETHFPDFARDETREWWADKVADFVSEHGQAGIWNDMNEPSVNITPHLRNISTKRLTHTEHGLKAPHLKMRNAYGHLEAMATFDGLLRARPDERPFIVSRSGFAGTQRYAAIWTGDNTSSWEHLHLSISIICGLGLSGIPFVGADIGGFIGNCTPELFARWIQLGSFYPFCRVHTQMISRAQQPWSFGSRVTKIAREYIKLRYSLLPYFYNAFYECSKTGVPVMRALVTEFQNDDPSTTIDDQFMVGPAIMAAPVIKQGARKRDVYLPPGEWIDFHTGERFPGSTIINVEAPLSKMPIFVRSGHIIPMLPPVAHTGLTHELPLILNVFCGAPAHLDLFEDDGNKYPADTYRITNFNYEEDSLGVRLYTAGVDAGPNYYHPPRNHVLARFSNIKHTPRKVILNGEEIEEAWAAHGDTDEGFEGWVFNTDNATLSVGVSADAEPFDIEVKY